MNATAQHIVRWKRSVFSAPSGVKCAACGHAQSLHGRITETCYAGAEFKACNCQGFK